jgi:hypothetical protein
LVAAVAVSSHSFWIDEGVTAWFASRSDLPDLYNAITTNDFPEALTPGYVLYMWVWRHIFGLSEFAFRCSNIPLLLALIASFSRLSRYGFSFHLLTALVCLSPMVWYYTNEARAYIALMSLTGVSLVGIIAYFLDKDRREGLPTVVMCAVVIGSFFNVLFSFSILALFIAGILLFRAHDGSIRYVRSDWIRPVLVSTPFLLIVFAYYAHTVFSGAGRGQREVPGLLNFAYVMYEYMGYGGVGPPRNVLRATRSYDVFVSFLPSLAFFSSMAFASIGALVYAKRWKLSGVFRNPFFIAAGLTVALYFSAAYSLSWRLLGRHLIFLYPFVVLGLAYSFRTTTRGSTKHHHPILFFVPLLLAWTFSDLRIRFDTKYAKEDYRSIVDFSIRLSRVNAVPIGWCADPILAGYYGLYLPGERRIEGRPRLAEGFSFINLLGSDSIFDRGTRDGLLLVVASKSDIFDRYNSVREFLRKNPMDVVFESNDFRVYLSTGQQIKK